MEKIEMCLVKVLARGEGRGEGRGGGEGESKHRGNEMKMYIHMLAFFFFVCLRHYTR